MIYKNNTFPRNNAHIIHKTFFPAIPPRMVYHIISGRCTASFFTFRWNHTPTSVSGTWVYIVCPLHCVFTLDPCVDGGTTPHIRYYHPMLYLRQKPEVPRDARNWKVRKQDTFRRDWSQPWNTCKSQSGTGPGVRRSKRPLLAYRTHCKCSIETSRNKVKSQIR